MLETYRGGPRPSSFRVGKTQNFDKVLLNWALGTKMNQLVFPKFEAP